jgi:hypothetical protein
VTRFGITPESHQLQYVELVSRVSGTVDLVFSVEKASSVTEIERKSPITILVIPSTALEEL